ncbi:hypothetical protein GGI04_004269 [Coemansia thaxteri]|uniref:DUF2423 domain-containing protein n=1 Tax=Coemansia thaxteri TaxID=2663907 RepID=A0A9W8B8L7_9FUNG|nr:hypothetical protein H4R26_004900 [Coemansia thaxteri]KAJ2000145.1 hypothetical protein GGI04_004269 [Coemansia thaxteri]KAJ2465273.1 hypothetical protein GGI02_004746 [Coemansia sp. RSA 2322]KAJ2478043.1 hypothetical protein EV174_004433 [Coemansia sp. RSA 2320]
MAKSVRSKSKIKSRNILRKTLFGPREEERIQRLAAKQVVEAATVTETETAAKMDEEAPDAEMEGTEKPTTLHRRKRRTPSTNGRVVVRNKKGRVLSRNSVKWVKQPRFKK